MDIKKELMQIRAMLNSALGNCEVSLRDYTVSSAQLDCVLEQAERAVLKLRTLTEMIRPPPRDSQQSRFYQAALSVVTKPACVQ